MPEQDLRRDEISAYRASAVTAQHNRALADSARFRGDVMIVESEFDAMVPHTAIENYRATFINARSITYRVIEDADRGLSDEAAQRSYTNLLVTRMTEMVRSAREDSGVKRD